MKTDSDNSSIIELETFDAQEELDAIDRLLPHPEDEPPSIDPTKPNPVRCLAQLEESRRKVDCEHASECLRVVVKLNWPNFSCQACGAYAPPPRVDPRTRIER
jgi:hypothetical protein